MARDDFSTYCVAKILRTDNTLNIVFKHQMSRIQLALSSNMDKSATFTYVTTESFIREIGQLVILVPMIRKLRVLN